VGYDYDEAGNRDTMQVTSGSHSETLTYDYDHANRVIYVVKDATETTDLTYDAGGRLNEIDYPNGVMADYDFDVMDRLDVLEYYTVPSNPFLSFDYAYDAAGNRTQVVEFDGSTLDSIEWQYDDAHRLEREERFDDTQTSITYTEFEYDDGGNRTEVDEDGLSTLYTYNDDDQVVTAGTATYSYDDRGNLETITDGSDVTNYDFDAQNRLELVTLPDTTTVSNDYDHDGRRIGQTVNSTETNYLWDEQSRYGDVVLETDSGGNALASYVLADTRLVSQERGSTSHYYLTDGQHSVRALSNSSAVTTDTYDYTAFGTSYQENGLTTNPYRFTGQQYDGATGLYSLRARFYDPSAGRFLSRDTWPINVNNPIELNRYGYTANNPINAFDPSGYELVFRGFHHTSLPPAMAGLAKGGLIVGAAIFLILLLMQTGVAEDLANLTDQAVQEAEEVVETIEEGVSEEVQQFQDILEEAANRVPPPSGWGKLARGILVSILLAGATFGSRPPWETPPDIEEPPDGNNDEEDCDYRVQRHIDQPGSGSGEHRPSNCQSHHGVPSVWMYAHYTNYDRWQAPTILMPNNPDHNATRSVQRTWEAEMRVKYNRPGRLTPWELVSYDDIIALAIQMLDATNTPRGSKIDYWIQFFRYEETLTPK
jgi:RHS repeat-associated protein